MCNVSQPLKSLELLWRCTYSNCVELCNNCCAVVFLYEILAVFKFGGLVPSTKNIGVIIKFGGGASATQHIMSLGDCEDWLS